MGHKLNLLILGFLIVLSWYKVIFTTFISEGYYYFKNGFLNQKFPHFFDYDEGARLLFDIFKVIFGDNIFLYHLFLLIILLALGFFFYFLVYETTDNKNISFISTLLFVTNYWSLFEYVGMGAYQEFAQRLVWFMLLFPSFIFFIKYLKTEVHKYFLWSIILYTLSLYLAEFSIFFLPFYFTYLISFYIWKEKINSYNIKKITLIMIYPVITLVIYYLDQKFGAPPHSNSNFIAFLFVKREEIIDLILRQLVIITIPSQITHSFIGNFHQAEFFQKIRSLYIPLLFLYLGALVFILKKAKHLRVISLACFIFIPLTFILNIFVREDYMLILEDGSRYMFVPSIGFTIFWSVFIYTFCRRTLLKIVAIILFLYWIFMNMSLISNGIERYEPKFKGTKISLNYIKSISSKFSEDSIIIIPSVLGDYGPHYVKYFYAKKNNFVAPYFRDWQNEIKRPIDPKKDFILNYDYKIGLIDETGKFNEIVERRKRIGNQDIQ